jgi:hypothetical protein
MSEPFEMFPVKAAAVVFDLECRPDPSGASHLDVLKAAVLSGVQRLESDDRFYVYTPDGDLGMCETLGEAVAAVSDHQDCKPALPLALKECLWLVRQYDPAHRAVFLFTNRSRVSLDSLDAVARPSHPFDPPAEVFLYRIGPAGRDRGTPHVTLRQHPTTSVLARAFDTDFSPLLVDR